MNRIIVTGGSGFIGTNIILYLFEKGYDVLNIDINNSEIPEIEKITSILDIRNYADFYKTMKIFCPDYIIHLAARTDLKGKTLDDYSANTLGIENLMRIIRDIPSLKKIIITSSMLVCHSGYHPKDQFDYSPSTIYGKSKVETEKIVWTNQPNCDWAIVRPTSIWGPYFKTPYKKFFDLIISRKYFHIGKKSCTKTYGYIGNAVYQLEKILFTNTSDINYKIFYLGDYTTTNIENWANEIAKELGIKILRLPFIFIKFAALFGDCLKPLNINFPLSSFRLKNMTTDNIIDLSDTKKIAPDLPFTRIEGIRKTLNCYRKL